MLSSRPRMLQNPMGELIEHARPPSWIYGGPQIKYEKGGWEGGTCSNGLGE